MRQVFDFVNYAMAAPGFCQWNGSPVSHILCNVTAILRASAIRAFAKPRFFATFIAHAFMDDQSPWLRLKVTWAAT